RLAAVHDGNETEARRIHVDDPVHERQKPGARRFGISRVAHGRAIPGTHRKAISSRAVTDGSVRAWPWALSEKIVVARTTNQRRADGEASEARSNRGHPRLAMVPTAHDEGTRRHRHERRGWRGSARTSMDLASRGDAGERWPRDGRSGRGSRVG